MATLVSAEVWYMGCSIMLPVEIIAAIVLEALKLVNWQLTNLPKDKAAEAAARFDDIVKFWTQWMPKPPVQPTPAVKP